MARLPPQTPPQRTSRTCGSSLQRPAERLADPLLVLRRQVAISRPEPLGRREVPPPRKHPRRERLLVLCRELLDLAGERLDVSGIRPGGQPRRVAQVADRPQVVELVGPA